MTAAVGADVLTDDVMVGVGTAVLRELGVGAAVAVVGAPLPADGGSEVTAAVGADVLTEAMKVGAVVLTD